MLIYDTVENTVEEKTFTIESAFVLESAIAYEYDSCYKPTTSSPKKGLNKLAIILPIVFGLLLIVAIASYILRRRSKRRNYESIPH